VIDPGHGGIDSGTNGTNGLMEKDLVLDEAIRLAHALMQAGAYTVHLTRDSDIYIPLRERRDIARSWHADLFISLHADSNPDIGVRGLSVYTLSESGSDREAAALARKENQSDVIAGVDLGGENSAVAPILIDLEQRDTLNRSSRFALGALTRLKGATDVLLRDPHRSAAFAVLKAPDVPAVLIELGYLSNAEDAAQMVLPRWRNAVADAIAGAVDEQFHPRPAIDDATASTAKFTGQE
jgi:N-acetylmuramoyl-L-alanine amidase